MTIKKTKDTSPTLLKELTEELLTLMRIEKAELKITSEEETIHLDINCPDQGILIGNNGETISSLQLVLAIMIYKKLGAWKRIVVNIGDYLAKKQESLKKMALNLSQRVKFSGQAMQMSYLNSAERRIIHMVLAEDPNVTTESIGEGRERKLIIKPKEQKLQS